MRRRDRRAAWVAEMTAHKVRTVGPTGMHAQRRVRDQFEYVDFDVNARVLSETLSEWGLSGWRCHTNSPNKTANGTFDGTVWVLLERHMP